MQKKKINIMIQIGKKKLGFVTLSTAVVFTVLSACVVAAAFRQTCPECAMPLSCHVFANMAMALAVSAAYGAFAHFAMVAINKMKH